MNYMHHYDKLSKWSPPKGKHTSRILFPHVAAAAATTTAGAPGYHETSTIAFKNTSHPS
jgi:hypothetical protein